MQNDSVIARWRARAPDFLSLLRIIAAFVFMQYGSAKLFAYPASLFPDGSTVHLASLLGIAGVLETFGGFLILVGLFTRPVAFVLSGEMAVAYFKGHAPNGFWTMLNHGEPAVLFCFLFLYLSAAGPGPWSLDAARHPSTDAGTT
ncbi:MAG: DoxX family protein [Gemmatimonadota bacterium]